MSMIEIARLKHDSNFPNIWQPYTRLRATLNRRQRTASHEDRKGYPPNAARSRPEK